MNYFTGILFMRGIWRPPSKGVSKKASTIARASTGLMKRAGSTRMLASLCCRANTRQHEFLDACWVSWRYHCLNHTWRYRKDTRRSQRHLRRGVQSRGSRKSRLNRCQNLCILCCRLRGILLWYFLIKNLRGRYKLLSFIISILDG